MVLQRLFTSENSTSFEKVYWLKAAINCSTLNPTMLNILLDTVPGRTNRNGRFRSPEYGFDFYITCTHTPTNRYILDSRRYPANSAIL